jgi:thioredoxin 1
MHRGADRAVQKPIIDALKKNYQDGKATVKKINIDENQDIALHLGIQSIPTIILFKEGRR